MCHADMIFLSASLITSEGDGDEIKAEMKQMLKMRAETQPQGVRTGGSTFANPDGHKAWQVILRQDAEACVLAMPACLINIVIS